MKKIICHIIAIIAVIFTFIFGQSKGVDYGYGDNRILAFAFVLIILGIVFGIVSLIERKNNKKSDLTLIETLIIIAAGIFILCMYWYDDSSPAVSVRHFMDDIIFPYIVSPILVVGCLLVLWIMFIRDPIRKMLGLDNNEKVGTVIEDDFNLSEDIENNNTKKDIL